MSVNICQTVKPFTLAALLFFSHASYIFAQQDGTLFNFKFNHLSNITLKNTSSENILSTKTTRLEFTQFDATWTYPWETKNVNIDVGLKLRHLSGFSYISENIGNSYFEDILPLLHASALFSLPLKGLSAGIEGSRFESATSQVIDYRAKVSYEWRNGFGLQGGWQHQQFSLDTVNNSGANFEKKGLYLDLYLKF